MIFRIYSISEFLNPSLCSKSLAPAIMDLAICLCSRLQIFALSPIFLFPNGEFRVYSTVGPIPLSGSLLLVLLYRNLTLLRHIILIFRGGRDVFLGFFFCESFMIFYLFFLIGLAIRGDDFLFFQYERAKNGARTRFSPSDDTLFNRHE